MVKVNLLARLCLYKDLDQCIFSQTSQQYLKVKPKHPVVQFIDKMQLLNLIKIFLIV